MLAYSGGFKQIVQGLAGYLPGGSCPCNFGGEDVGPLDCVIDSQPLYCDQYEPIGGGDLQCQIIYNCGECGCPEGKECYPDGRCLNPGTTVVNDEGDTKYCDSHFECKSGELCVNSAGDLLNLDEDPSGSCDGYSLTCGACKISRDGDGHCASNGLSGYEPSGSYETCEDNLKDCEGLIGLWGGCSEGQICEENLFFPGVGICSPYLEQDICSDGTSLDTCSIVTQGFYCSATGELIEDCSGGDGIINNGNDCSCGNGLTCQNAGTDVAPAWECLANTQNENVDTDIPLGQEEDGFVNYCSQVGGQCQESCTGDYYELNHTNEYNPLHQACMNKYTEDHVCCYPYSNAEVNDCAYYGGSCMSECSGDYYSAEVDYLDNECEYYEGSGSVCCLEYATETNEGSTQGQAQTSFWDNLFGSPENEDYNPDEYIKLGENVSLNRNIVFAVIIIVAVAAFAIASRIKPKKIKKRKKR